MRFYTSDLHIFHTNILGYCDRPFKDVDQMWKTIRKNWNNTVKQEDEVYVVGDLTLKTESHLKLLTKMIHELNGLKHMIVAPTHDLFLPRQYEEMGFATVHYPGIRLDNDWFVAHDPAVATALPKDSVLICGHVHNLMTSQLSRTGVLMINVGVDVRNFTPISEKQILEIISHGEVEITNSGASQEESTAEHMQNACGCTGLQQGRCMCDGKNKSPRQGRETNEEGWRAARRASINGGSLPEGNS